MVWWNMHQMWCSDFCFDIYPGSSKVGSYICARIVCFYREDLDIVQPSISELK